MLFLPALLHSFALIIGLFVQTMSSPLAGAWLFFHISGCAVLLYTNEYDRQQSAVWYSCLAWLTAIGASAFLFAPVVNGAAYMWVLIAMPSLALCLQKDNLPAYLKCFGGVITAYAVGLVAQKLLHVHYTNFDYNGRIAWPLLDPNNAACVVNIALVPCFYAMLTRDTCYGFLCTLFAAALYATGSKAGIGSTAACCTLIAFRHYGLRFALFCCLWAVVEAASIYICRPEWILMLADSLADRFPIWQASWQLLWVRPTLGLGLGSFSYYYAKVRTETYTVGAFAHNDLLQFAIELGIPAALTFCSLALAVLVKTCKENVVAACTMLAVLLQAMVEFQFYLPAVSIPMGLALAYHMLNRNEPKGLTDAFRQ
jgi:O-antigen ligase